MCGKQAELFKVLGVESRIRIIELLKQKGPLGVIELSETLGLTPSAVSQHLKILKHAGLVRSERKGYWIPYEVDPDTLEQCGGLLSEVCNCGCKAQRSCHTDSCAATGELDHLRERERRLQKELDEVRTRIRAKQEGR
ncbi:MAG: ArsR/SmtB family transcription factor [Armatimonadota bacterium]